MLALIGFTLMIVLMFVLIKEKMAPPLAFILLPIIAAALAGFGVTEISEFIKTGMKTMMSTAILFIFSISYFTLMSDAGLFDPIIDFLIKRTGKSITTVLIAVLLTTFVAHLDGSGATTFLIVVPAFLPICKKMKIRPQALLAAMCGGYGVMNLVPWGGPTIRAATAIEMDATELWVSMIPMQIFGLIISLGAAVICGKTETMRLKKAGVDLAALSAEVEAEKDEDKDGLRRPKLFWVDLILTILVIAALVKSGVAPYLIFMFGTMIALMINYPDMGLQGKLLKKYAPSCIDLTVTLIGAGVFLGIFANSGIITSMAQVLIGILPKFMVKYLYIIMGILGGPIGLIMGPDPYYYAVMPLVIETVAPYGITAAQVAKAMLIGENVVLSVSPCVPANYLAFGISGIDLNDHMKFSFKWEWLVSILMLIFALVVGIV